MELAQCIRQGISSLLEELCRQAGRSVSEIDGMVITGNTAMLHLLTATDISPLAAAPFAVKERFGRCVPAGEMCIRDSLGTVRSGHRTFYGPYPESPWRR